jgi:hypothetical protein
MDAQIVNLNVGGALFTTTLATLRSQPGSTLSAMFAGDHSGLQQDVTGNYFIDRDGTHFRHILNFLRDGTLPLVESQAIKNEMKMEAAFYHIPQLLQWSQVQEQNDPHDSAVAIQVLDAYTMAVKRMLAMVYGRPMNELLAEIFAALTASAEKGCYHASQPARICD